MMKHKASAGKNDGQINGRRKYTTC